MVGLLGLIGASGAAPALAAKPAGDGPAISFTTILGGYTRPVLVTHDGTPKKRLFIVEQTGRILVARYRDGAWRKAGVFLDLRTRVNDPLTEGSERGLLGLAFHPEYASNGRFYVNDTRRASGAKNGDTVIAEYRRAGPLVADPGSRRLVRTIEQPQGNHNGGHLAFGPDGYLYIGTGDGGGGGDPDDNGQDLGSRLGKLLRIDPLDPDGPGPQRYAVPPGNPYIGETEKRAEIWAEGLRNPWRYSFDRGTGDLWIGDVGQNAWEEIDHVPATGGVGAGMAADFGWNTCEGDVTYPGSDPCDHGALDQVDPVFVYSHDPGGPADDGCSVTGGYVFRGPGADPWRGVYLFGDLCNGKVSALDQHGNRLLTVSSGRTVSSFGEDVAGRLYLVDLGGSIARITFSGDPTP